MTKYCLLALLVLGIIPAQAQQAQPSAVEQKLRENLRSTMLQLRTVENDRLILQATQTENEQKIKTLTTKVESLLKQLGDEKDAADKAQADLQGKLTERDRSIAEVNLSLEKWKADHKRISEIATVKETQRAKLAGEVVVFQRRVDDQQARNAAMYKVGSEVLRRYEKFVLGDALSAREPFTGIARVKFQTLAQDFRDQLDDTRITPEAPTGTGPSAVPEKPAAVAKTEKPAVVAKTNPAVRGERKAKAR